MFGFIKNKLQKIYSTFATKVQELLNVTTIDEDTLKQLETVLLQADTGVKSTRLILENVRRSFSAAQNTENLSLRTVLHHELLKLLTAKQVQASPQVYVLVGINGSGKTTFAGKLAHQKVQEGKKVLLVAGDTFRAAATEQLSHWAAKSGLAVVVGKEQQEPASVVFAGCEKFNNEGYDVLIIDTAGRLQTKVNLMKELEKIKRIITTQLPHKSICTLLTIDSMLGQNSLEQARIFNESTAVDGVVLTKMDGTGKGGIIFAIAQELGIPVAYLSYGEGVDQLKQFDAQEYVTDLLNG